MMAGTKKMGRHRPLVMRNGIKAASAASLGAHQCSLEIVDKISSKILERIRPPVGPSSWMRKKAAGAFSAKKDFAPVGATT